MVYGGEAVYLLCMSGKAAARLLFISCVLAKYPMVCLAA